MEIIRFRKLWSAMALALILVMVTSAYSSSHSPASASSSGPLTVAMVQPFSGPDGRYGPELGSGCYAAAVIIGRAGGVLGHKSVNCLPVDTRGDPVDAVPAVGKMLATSSQLIGVLGPSSDEASATVPLITTAKVPMFADTGQVQFDHNTSPYFWRSLPSDDFYGYAMAKWAYDRGYRRAVLVFGNDIGSQGSVPTLIKGFKKLGGKILINEAVPLDQSSYQSVAAKVAALKPDVIFNELDPQTAATFFGELQQLHPGLFPLVATSSSMTPWLTAVAQAVGKKTIAHVYTDVFGASPPSTGSAYKDFKTGLLAPSTATHVSKPAQYSQDLFAESWYDSTITYALAALNGHSTQSSIINSNILKVVTPGKGIEVVHTFAQGKRALVAGRRIDYVGATGQLTFNKYHNSLVGFEVLGYASTENQQKVLKVYPASSVATLVG